MTEAEKKARLAELLRIKEQRAQADLSSLTVRGEAKKRLDDARDEVAKLEEIAKGGFTDSFGRGIDKFKGYTFDPINEALDGTTPLNTAAGIAGSYAGLEGANAVYQLAKGKPDALSAALNQSAEKLDNTPKAGTPKAGEMRVSVEGALDPSKGLNANRETMDTLKDFKSKLETEGVKYDDLKKYPGSMKQKLEAAFNEKVNTKYKTLIGRGKDLMDKGKGGKFLKKTAIYGTGIPAAVTGGALVHNVFTSLGAAGEADEARKEIEVFRKKIPAFTREYNQAKKSWVDNELIRVGENDPNYQRLKVLQGKLETLLK